MENYFTEYKSRIDLNSEENKNKLIKEIVAFLNSNGGFIYIGIEDNGNVIGVNGNIDDYITKITSIIFDRILPGVRGLVTVYQVVRNDKNVCCIEISDSERNNYYDRKYGLTPKGYFIRNRTSALTVSQEEIDRLYYSDKILPENKLSKEQELTFNKFTSQLNEVQLNDDFANISRKFNLLTRGGAYNQLAFLVSDQFSGTFNIDVYAGDMKTADLTIYKLEYRNYLDLISKVVDNVSSLNKTHLKTSGSLRNVQTIDYDTESLRELVINSFAHRDLNTNNLPKISFFDSKFEIQTIGEFGISKEDLVVGASVPVNSNLAFMLHSLNLMERRGIGLSKVIAVYGVDVFHISSNFTIVSLPKSITVYPALNFNDSSPELSFFNEPKSVKDYMDYINQSRATAQRKLYKLLEDDKLVRIGNGRGTKYIKK